jgi:hypothetical protein
LLQAITPLSEQPSASHTDAAGAADTASKLHLVH